jgi:hypothetical protein
LCWTTRCGDAVVVYEGSSKAFVGETERRCIHCRGSETILEGREDVSVGRGEGEGGEGLTRSRKLEKSDGIPGRGVYPDKGESGAEACTSDVGEYGLEVNEAVLDVNELAVSTFSIAALEGVHIGSSRG